MYQDVLPAALVRFRASSGTASQQLRAALQALMKIRQAYHLQHGGM
jgi:hypothetical protein